ncbi:transcriptional regulator [Embleya sp. NBC_00896]|uniref:winged helix-turn-helix domain-containing protein n=1 Tax=Embleya sp. NBC_00896 TaxID=2975961 RepID=UPI002F9091A8|nr:transcriptional regulator [Embleya sp. NBC_00896]
MSHPRHALDDIIHSPVRFSIMATLAAAEKAEFAYVRDTVEVTDPVLSKQAALLEKAGYVKITKGYVGKRPRTWLSLTTRGCHAFTAHVEALRAITENAD